MLQHHFSTLSTNNVTFESWIPKNLFAGATEISGDNLSASTTAFFAYVTSTVGTF
jgi:hypothetical protein